MAEASAASKVANNVLLNGGGVNGGGVNGGGVNGGGVNGGGVNGGGVNGGGVNGGGVNGDTANLVGFTFDLDTITSITLNGASLNNASLENGYFTAKLGSKTLSGQALVGTKVAGKLDDGTKLTLRLESVQSFTSAVGAALPRYVISYTLPGQSGTGYVCGKNNGVPIRAIPITGQWNFEQGVPGGGEKIEDSSQLTFACEGYALYKCIDYGYPPWAKKNGVSLDDHHQACVRMIRADYCGDGRSWTVNGTVINMYDKFGIQKDTESWPIEAEWDIDGARCLSHQRIQGMEAHPGCSFERTPAACGSPPQWGPTLMTSEAL